MASNISESEVEVEEEPAGGYIELECVDSPFSDSSSSSEHESEDENDDIELDGVGDDADEAHVPQMGANPYLFEPLLPEGAPPRDEPAAVNPAIQERLQVLDWCQCGNCTLMQTVTESICCREYQPILDTMEQTDTPDACITQHEAFDRIVLCPFVLRVAYIGYSNRDRRQMPRDQQGRYRYTAYRQVVRWNWGILGRNNRIPLPSCVVGAIVRAYPPQQGQERRGFHLPLLD